MNIHTLLLFSATVLPLVCTPGPDILYVASQAVSGGSRAGLRATAGVLLGYGVHSMLVALGLAAVVATSPMLFEVIKWIGIAYLIFLASKLIRSAMRSQEIVVPKSDGSSQYARGFLTALLNPKGMMVYVAVLPQFMNQQGNATLQAVMLSLTFIVWCALIYSAICLSIPRVGGSQRLSDKRRRLIDGVAGGMILGAAGFMATAHR